MTDKRNLSDAYIYILPSERMDGFFFRLNAVGIADTYICTIAY
jgi:hypothetical protein